MDMTNGVRSEVSLPSWRGGDGALFVLVFLSLGAAVAVKALLELWGVPGTAPACACALVLVGLSFWQRLAHYRYTLSDRSFTIERIAGRKPRLLAELPLAGLRLEQGVKRPGVVAAPGGKKNATAVISRGEKGERVYYVDISRAFARELEERIKAQTA